MSQDIQKQVQRLNQKCQRLANIETKRASSAALNKTAAKIRTQVVRGVSKETRIPGKHIRKRVYIKRSSARTQFARLTAYRRDISLNSLKPRQLKKGFSAAGRKYPSAFRAKGRNGSEQIFQRKGKARYPIEVVKVPISEHVDRITPKVARQIFKREYPRLLAHEIDYRSKKLSSNIINT